MCLTDEDRLVRQAAESALETSTRTGCRPTRPQMPVAGWKRCRVSRGPWSAWPFNNCSKNCVGQPRASRRAGQTEMQTRASRFRS